MASPFTLLHLNTKYLCEAGFEFVTCHTTSCAFTASGSFPIRQMADKITDLWYKQSLVDHLQDTTQIHISKHMTFDSKEWRSCNTVEGSSG